MGVVHLKSTEISNRDAVPPVLNQGAVTRGRLQRAVGKISIANGDSIGSTYRALSIPSNAIVSSVLITSPDIGTTTIADIGLYRTTKDGGAVVDADFFASALSLKDGALTRSEQMFESAVNTVANYNQPVWDKVSGLTADPGCDYDVALTLTAAADAAGDVLVEVFFAQ